VDSVERHLNRFADVPTGDMICVEPAPDPSSTLPPRVQHREPLRARCRYVGVSRGRPPGDRRGVRCCSRPDDRGTRHRQRRSDQDGRRGRVAGLVERDHAVVEPRRPPRARGSERRRVRQRGADNPVGANGAVGGDRGPLDPVADLRRPDGRPRQGPAGRVEVVNRCRVGSADNEASRVHKDGRDGRRPGHVNRERPHHVHLVVDEDVAAFLGEATILLRGHLW
jgi:hypothetical protein